MRTNFAILALATAVAGCSYTPHDLADRGLSAVHVPVVTRADFAFDISAPYGNLSASEAARLDAWFRSLDLGYGDSIYVDGPDAFAAKADIARVAGAYGMLVSQSAPVTAGAVPAGSVRVVVSRNRAEVPGCPDWSTPSQPNYNNRTMPNFGCGVNSNLAAMVANPEDLIHGREGSGVADAITSAKAVSSYYRAAPTGEKGLQDISTNKKDQ